jgi:hypothetical protein
VTTPPATQPARHARHELINALVEHGWARPGTQRPAAKPHIVVMVAVFAAAAAVGAGLVLQLIHPIRMPKPPAPPPKPPAPAPPFTAVTGWNCAATSADYGFTAQNRTSAWYTVSSGGWTQDGCDGSFEAVPMTRSQPGQGPSQVAEWWFTPSAAMTRCTVLTYQPGSLRRPYAAATAAQFYVLSGQNGSPLAGFVVDQRADPGSWAAAGTYPVSPSGIAIELVDGGQRQTPADLLAITQVKVSCTG